MELGTGAAAARAAAKVASLVKRRPGAVRLGSRQERRAVYARFLAATITSVGLVQHARFQRVRYRWFMRDKAIDKLEDHQLTVSVELMQAYADLQLAANPQPLAAADQVMADLDLLFRGAGERQAEHDAAMDRLGASQAAFTQAARHDLWYSPRWWQIWRWGLLKAAYRKVIPPKPPQLGRAGRSRSPSS